MSFFRVKSKNNLTTRSGYNEQLSIFNTGEKILGLLFLNTSYENSSHNKARHTNIYIDYIYHIFTH